jgi:hypothetical protein
MGFDIDAIKNTIISAYHSSSDIAGKWMGHGISVLKSGKEVLLPYLQDRRIALVSLISVSLILIELGQLFKLVFERILPNSTERQKSFNRYLQKASGCAILIGGTAFFVKHANLPLRWIEIT